MGRGEGESKEMEMKETERGFFSSVQHQQSKCEDLGGWRGKRVRYDI